MMMILGTFRGALGSGAQVTAPYLQRQRLFPTRQRLLLAATSSLSWPLSLSCSCVGLAPVQSTLRPTSSLSWPLSLPCSCVGLAPVQSTLRPTFRPAHRPALYAPCAATPATLPATTGPGPGAATTTDFSDSAAKRLNPTSNCRQRLAYCRQRLAFRQLPGPYLCPCANELWARCKTCL